MSIHMLVLIGIISVAMACAAFAVFFGVGGTSHEGYYDDGTA